MFESGITVSWINIPKENLVLSNDTYDIYEKVEGGLVLSITLLKAGQATRGHKHPHWENYQFDEDGLTLLLNGFAVDMPAGKTMIIPPNMHHAVRNNTDKDIPFLCIWHEDEAKAKDYGDTEKQTCCEDG